MGIENGKDLLYEINGLNGAALKVSAIVASHDKRNKTPCVAIDCNWVAFYLTIGRKTTSAAKNTSNLILLLKRMGFKVVPITDGVKRYHTKRASIDRSVSRYVKNIEGVIARNKLLSINQHMRNGKSNESDLTTMKKEKDRCVKVLNSSKKSLYTLPNSFADDLIKELRDSNAFETNENGGYVADVQVAVFQADSVIAFLLTNKEVDLIFSNDSDIHVLCGCNCLQVCDFKIKAGKGKSRNLTELMELTNIKIKTPFKSCVECISSKLTEIDAPNIMIKEAKYPIIEVLGDHAFPYLRGMVAVVLGCDVIKGGVKEVGPAKVYKYLSSKIIQVEEGYKTIHTQNAHLCKCFLDWIIEQDKVKNRTKQFYDTLVLAFIAEPCITEIDIKKKKAWKYLIDKKKYLSKSMSKYLLNYVKDKTCIVHRNIPKTRMCKGHPEYGKHMFLLGETKDPIVCVICKHAICYHCNINHSGEQILCIKCWTNECQIQKVDKEENSKTVADIRKKIIDHGWKISELETTTEEVVEIYDTLVTKQSINLFKRNNVKVMLPMFNQ